MSQKLHTVCIALILTWLQETFDQNQRWMNSYLNHEVQLGLRVVLRGLPALAGQVHCVTPPAAPRHGHVTVVRQPRDPLAAREDTRTEKESSSTNMQMFVCFLYLILVITSIVVNMVPCAYSYSFTCPNFFPFLLQQQSFPNRYY